MLANIVWTLCGFSKMGRHRIMLPFPGSVPEDVQKLFVEAAAEALTNAISHAHAKTLFVTLAETELSYSASFRNDGTRPDGEITEGGGLGSLRKKLEREGGSMEIKSHPDFELMVTLPKKGGNEL
jgi:signal transduction histidine kinase